ncbi:HD domain-containing protein [Candidatus Bathyarchaeota archaeon]|nr:HD domain-containing protein [Candidatus Bathyarchaeota archaeon]
MKKNDFGLEHTQRVYDLAKRYFSIPKKIQDLVFSSLILHDIGGSSINDQYQKGPKIAKALLEQLNTPLDLIEEVCEIIRTHHNHPIAPSLSFQILYDSDKLVMLTPEEFSYYDLNSNINWLKIIDLIYTDKIKQLAKEFLNNRTSNDG